MAKHSLCASMISPFPYAIYVHEFSATEQWSVIHYILLSRCVTLCCTLESASNLLLAVELK
jgi:hypothetical protein